MISKYTLRRNHGQKTHDPLETTNWIIPNGATARPIGYIANNHKYRNCVRNVHTMENWMGDMEQPIKHSAVITNLQLHFGKDYFYKIPPGTGADISYNHRHARKQPELRGQYKRETKYAPNMANDAIRRKTGNV